MIQEVVLRQRTTKDLPFLCGQLGRPHRWAITTVHGCGAGSGDQAVDEALVLPTFISTPVPGAVCDDCFQVFGETAGARNSAMVAAYLALLSWQ